MNTFCKLNYWLCARQCFNMMLLSLSLSTKFLSEGEKAFQRCIRFQKWIKCFELEKLFGWKLWKLESSRWKFNFPFKAWKCCVDKQTIIQTSGNIWRWVSDEIVGVESTQQKRSRQGSHNDERKGKKKFYLNFNRDLSRFISRIPHDMSSCCSPFGIVKREIQEFCTRVKRARLVISIVTVFHLYLEVENNETVFLDRNSIRIVWWVFLKQRRWLKSSQLEIIRKTTRTIYTSCTLYTLYTFDNAGSIWILPYFFSSGFRQRLREFDFASDFISHVALSLRM